MLPNDKPIPDRILKWAANAIHPDARVHSYEQLHGGISSIVHGISLSIGGKIVNVVLRQFDNAEWVRSEPDLAVREAASLRRASQAGGVLTPRMIAFDETGSQCGMPTVLMTRLEGKVVLAPDDLSGWLGGMAQSIARIHSAAAPDDFAWTYAPYSDAASLDTSSWSKLPDKWKTAVDIVTGRLPSYAKRFIHRDFHPANVLWHGGQVSGVVDWVNGCIGPAGVDVGHCRVNLALLHGVRTADQFLTLYRGYAGDAYDYDPYWDLVTLIDFAYGPPPEVYAGWTALGMTGLTDEMMMQRLDAYLISLVKRVS